MHLLYATVHLNLKKSVLISYSRIGIFITEKKLSLQPSMFLTSHYGCCSVFFFSFVRRDCSCTFSLFMFSLFLEKELSYSSVLGCQPSPHSLEPFLSAFFSLQLLCQSLASYAINTRTLRLSWVTAEVRRDPPLTQCVFQAFSSSLFF